MTEVVYNQFAPGGCFKQLSDAADGSGIAYSQYAVGGPANQLRTHINPALVLDQRYPGGVWGQAYDEVESEGGAGPEWVPADAKIYIDFLNDRAWTEADGEVAVGILLGNDPAADSGVGTDSEYDSSRLTVDGYTTADDHMAAFIGTARTLLLAGATVRFGFKQLQLTGNKTGSVFLASEDGGDGLEIDASVAAGPPVHTTISAYSYNGSANDTVDDVLNSAIGAVNGLAFTVTNTRLEVAANGNTSIVAQTLDATDRPPGNPFVCAAFQFEPNFAAVQSITLYDPLPDTTGLSALSAVT